MKVAVLGAGGFVGRALLKKYQTVSTSPKTSVEWVAIQRSEPSKDIRDAFEWRSCDLLEPIQAEIALAGVDTAIYLVHSMAPTGIELQGHFEDIDALIALNVAEAARRQGVKRIIYLGGLIPENKHLSRHLESRLEVERILRTSGCPVISLRAGLVIGAQGSSFDLMSALVKRLPVMLCPSWTNSRTEAVALEDVVDAILESLRFEIKDHVVYDLGNEEPVTYRELMMKTADAMGIKRRFLSIPAFTPALSVLWVGMITKARRELIRPLVQSLREDMLPRQKFRFPRSTKPVTLKAALEHAVNTGRDPANLIPRKIAKRLPHWGFETRIINRLPYFENLTEVETGRAYFHWLGKFLPGIIRVRQMSLDKFQIHLGPFTTAFLVLSRKPDQERPGFAFYEIEQGLLVRRETEDADATSLQSFSFRRSVEAEVSLGIIENYSPRLPRWTYRWTQALAHEYVMKWFGNDLRRKFSRPLKTLESLGNNGRARPDSYSERP